MIYLSYCIIKNPIGPYKIHITTVLTGFPSFEPKFVTLFLNAITSSPQKDSVFFAFSRANVFQLNTVCLTFYA